MSRTRQRGGVGSDYGGLYHAWTADPGAQTRYTQARINDAPMFHPLRAGHAFPTGTSGVIPTGTYYAHVGGGNGSGNGNGNGSRRLTHENGPRPPPTQRQLD